MISCSEDASRENLRSLRSNWLRKAVAYEEDAVQRGAGYRCAEAYERGPEGGGLGG